MSVEKFFWYARERQSVLLRRRAGCSRPWTDDPALNQYRFCNVFREDDRTTEWFRINVRDPLRDSPDVLLATVLFRWFNRISTGEAIFTQKNLLGGDTAWFTMMTELESNNWRADQGDGASCVDPLRHAIKAYIPNGPYVTGSYIIRGTPGHDKLDGVLDCVRNFMSGAWDYPGASQQLGPQGWREVAEMLLADRTWHGTGGQFATLEATWRWLKQVPFLGDFMAYEIVTDLRHTALLDLAPDVQTWANPGPGAARGAGRMLYGDKDHYRQTQKTELNAVMRDVVEWSRSPAYWPQWSSEYGEYVTAGYDLPDGVTQDWPAWEMRDAEHTLCEYFKHARGYSRNVFR